MKRAFTAFSLGALLLLQGCSSGKTEPAGETVPQKGALIFKDLFDGDSLGELWNNTGAEAYGIVNGELRARGAHNKPLWLKKKLPRNALIEFKARSMSPAVDIKVEAYGDGVSFAKKASYTATSYVIILGGWNNSRSIIARMDEHGSDRMVRTDPKGERGKTYSFSISRFEDKLEWKLDGKPFLELVDPDPLKGKGHEHFGINNWESEVYFDDLHIYELREKN